MKVLDATELSPDHRLARPIRVLVADDSPLARSAIRTLLASRQEVEMIGDAADGEEAVRRAKALCPDLILMDLQMPKLDGLRATRMVRDHLPQVRIIVVTVNNGPEVQQTCLAGGADGFVTKDRIYQDLLAEIRRVFPSQSP